MTTQFDTKALPSLMSSPSFIWNRKKLPISAIATHECYTCHFSRVKKVVEIKNAGVNE